MEIADIFVVNKADREGADRTVASIEALLSLERIADGRWRPPIVKTEATTGKGVPELVARSSGSARTPPRRWASGAARAPSSGVNELLAHRFVQHVERPRAGGRGVRRMLDRDCRARDRSVHGRGRDHRARWSPVGADLQVGA